MPDTSTKEILSSIDQKLSALLALAIADRLPETARARSRSLDSVLRASGMAVADIAVLMGKTRQAVDQSLKADAGRKSSRPGKTASAGKSKRATRKPGV